jgi:hypothetical protein
MVYIGVPPGGVDGYDLGGMPSATTRRQLCRQCTGRHSAIAAPGLAAEGPTGDGPGAGCSKRGVRDVAESLFITVQEEKGDVKMSERAQRGLYAGPGLPVATDKNPTLRTLR